MNFTVVNVTMENRLLYVKQYFGLLPIYPNCPWRCDPSCWTCVCQYGVYIHLEYVDLHAYRYRTMAVQNRIISSSDPEGLDRGLFDEMM